MRFRAEDLYEALKREGCEPQDGTERGDVWLTRSFHPFILPKPFLEDGTWWLDADVVVETLCNRWVGFTLPATLRRYS